MHRRIGERGTLTGGSAALPTLERPQRARTAKVRHPGPYCQEADARKERGRTRRREPSGKREGYQRVAEPVAELSVSPGGNDHVLPAVRLQSIRHGRGLAARGQPAFPQLLARVGVKGAQVLVAGGSGDEGKSGRRGDGASEAGHAVVGRQWDWR